MTTIISSYIQFVIHDLFLGDIANEINYTDAPQSAVNEIYEVIKAKYPSLKVASSDKETERMLCKIAPNILIFQNLGYYLNYYRDQLDASTSHYFYHAIKRKIEASKSVSINSFHLPPDTLQSEFDTYGLIHLKKTNLLLKFLKKI